MVVIHLSDCPGSPLVDTFELGIHLCLKLLAEHGGYWLVHQFITQYHRFVLVSLGYSLPDVAEELLACFTLEKPGITMSIVDIVACLSARAVVHVQNQMQAVFAAPFYGLSIIRNPSVSSFLPI